MSETRSSHWETRNVHAVVIGKSLTKILHDRFRCSWRDDIKFEKKKTGLRAWI